MKTSALVILLFTVSYLHLETSSYYRWYDTLKDAFTSGSTYLNCHDQQINNDSLADAEIYTL